MQKFKRALAAILCLAMLITLLPSVLTTEVLAYDESEATMISFSGATVEVSGVNADSVAYETSSDTGTTAVTISSKGIYVLSGTCDNGSITIAKGSGAVNLVLDGLNLTCTSSAPLETKGGNTLVTVTTAAGSVNVLSDTDRGAAKPKAAINASKAITFDGEGVLFVNGNNKNGIKSDTDVNVIGGTITVTSVDNCIAADNSINVSGGSLLLKAVTAYDESEGAYTSGDCLKASPDAYSDSTLGDIVISGGSVTAESSLNDCIQALHDCRISGGILELSAYDEGIVADDLIAISGGRINITAETGDGMHANPDLLTDTALGNIEIDAGVITVRAAKDGIQAANSMTITGGCFDIQTAGGYNDSSFNGDTSTAKGLKVAHDAVDGETVTSANTLTISGGEFGLNCADDAIHTDGYVTITDGVFSIYTGDDGVHANTALKTGTADGSGNPQIYVYASYEGLEAGQIDVYSGNYYVISDDDGINAAGDSARNDYYSKGSRWINVYGGSIYMEAGGDGLDSNGSLSISGGTHVIFAALADGANEALDCETTKKVTGGTVLALDRNGMPSTNPSCTQTYRYSSSLRCSSGTSITVKDGSGNIVMSYVTPTITGRNVPLQYAFFTSPECTSSYKLTADSSGCSHSYQAVTVRSAASCETVGRTDYVCASCGSGYTKVGGYAVHSYSATVIAPDCVHAGYTLYSCACGATYASDYVASAGEHTWDNGTVTQEVTADQNGIITYTCTVCGETKETVLPAGGSPFLDVQNSSRYYYKPVLWAVSANITNGVSATLFAPEKDCTREQVVTFLWRAVGSPTPNITAEDTGFTDLPSESSSYYNAILWGYETGVVKGVSPTAFGFKQTVTRAQFVTFLWRLAGSPDPTITAEDTGFTDMPSESSSYYKAILWAYENEITKGESDTLFNPGGSCKRCQVVTFLYRYFYEGKGKAD